MKTGDLVKYAAAYPTAIPAGHDRFNEFELGVVLHAGTGFCKVIWFFNTAESSSTYIGKDYLELVSENW